jgi:hypothetical protein
MITVTFSGDAALRICQRRWFFTSLVAHPTAKKDWIRREAHILRQLVHPPAWAGKLIHTTLEKLVLPAVCEGSLPDINDIVGYARSLMERQAEFSRKKMYRSISKAQAGGDFCALFADEYDDGLTLSQRDDTEWRVVTALTNIPALQSLWATLKLAQPHFIEHAFRVHLPNGMLEAKPDLGLVRGRRVTIVDWKSWASWTADPGDQLHFYAHALGKYWSSRGLRAQDFELIGVNLLQGAVASITCTEEDLDAADDRVLEFEEQAKTLVRGRSWSEIPLRSLGTPRHPETCTSCKFRKICRDAVSSTQEGTLWAAL